MKEGCTGHNVLHIIHKRFDTAGALSRKDINKFKSFNSIQPIRVCFSTSKSFSLLTLEAQALESTFHGKTCRGVHSRDAAFKI